MTHALRRHRHLRRDARPDARGQCRGDAGAAAAGQGRAGHRQDDARRGSCARARPAADAVARQVDDQGAAGPVRIRRGVAAARLAARRRARRRHRALHQARRAVAGVRFGDAGGRADRRSRQGRHRVSERSAARARPDGVLRLRDAGDDQARATARSSSSPATTKRSCRMRSCGAASSTTSAFPTRRRWRASSTCISRT